MGYLTRQGSVKLELHDDGRAFLQIGMLGDDIALDQLLDLAAVLAAPHVSALLASAVEQRDRDAYAVEQARWAACEAEDRAMRAAREQQQGRA
jgi:hypothetical protein